MPSEVYGLGTMGTERVVFIETGDPQRADDLRQSLIGLGARELSRRCVSFGSNAPSPEQIAGSLGELGGKEALFMVNVAVGRASIHFVVAQNNGPGITVA